jgi:hypothetical protein
VTPKWKDVDTGECSCLTIICLTFLTNFFLKKDNYTKLCTIEADLSRVPLSPRPKASGKGNFYRVDYDIVLLFGMTELKAQVTWKENVSEGFQVYSFKIIEFHSTDLAFSRERRNGVRLRLYMILIPPMMTLEMTLLIV